jgi:hypothetical protein
MDGGDSGQGFRLAHNEFQRLLGMVLAIYGFFMAAFPDRYTLPLVASFSQQQNSAVGLLLLFVGGYLFITRRSVFTW